MKKENKKISKIYFPRQATTKEKLKNKHAMERQFSYDELFRNIFNNTRFGICIMSSGYDILGVNPGFAGWFRKPAKDMIGNKCYREFEKRDQICPHCPGRISMESGEACEVETKGTRNDGSQVYVKISTIPLFDPTGKACGFIEITDEITGHKIIEEKLQLTTDNLELSNNELRVSNQQLSLSNKKLRISNQRLKAVEKSLRAANKKIKLSEERVRILFEVCPEGILAANVKKMNFKYANPAICKMLGYSESELLKIRVRDIHPKESVNYVMNEFKAQVRGEKTLITNIPCLRKDKKIIYVNISAAPMNFEDGKFLAGFFTDITERKLAEDALRESQLKYKDLVENINEFIWEVDINGKYTYLSPKVKDFLGYEVGEVLGRSPFDFMPSEEAKKIRGIFKEIVRKKEALKNLENVNLHKNGWLIILETSGIPLFDKEGNLTGYRGIDRDITEKKKMEEQLLQTQKMDAIGVFASGIVHDFNNFLATISGYADLFLDEYAEKDKKREYIEEVRKQAEHASKVVKQILNFARPFEETSKILDIRQVIYDTLELLRPDTRSAVNINVVSRENNFFSGNHTQIQQMFLNLFTNACDAMRKSKYRKLDIIVNEVSFTPEEASSLAIVPGRYLKIIIKDTGCGMTPEVIDKIFELFFTSKVLGSGTGLGLPMARRIIERHNGAITVVSEVGKGTTFTIYLPVSYDKISEKPKVIRKNSKKARILIVEDNQSLRNSYEITLKKLGYELKTAANGAKAMEIFLADPNYFDIILADQMMPNMIGVEMSKEILKIRPDMPIIIVTAYSTISNAEAKKLGIKYVISKPVNFSALSNIIDDMVNRS